MLPEARLPPAANEEGGLTVMARMTVALEPGVPWLVARAANEVEPGDWGVPVIAPVLGHGDVRVTSVYATVLDETSDAAVALLAGAFDAGDPLG